MADRYGYRDDDRWRSGRDWDDRDRDFRNRDFESRGYSNYERNYGDRGDSSSYRSDNYGGYDPTRRYGTAWNRDDDWWRNAEPRGMNHFDDDRGMSDRGMGDRNMNDRGMGDRMRHMGDRMRQGWDRMTDEWRDRDRGDRNDWHDYDRDRGLGRSFGGSDRGHDRSWDRDRGVGFGNDEYGYGWRNESGGGREDYMRGRDYRSGSNDRMNDRDRNRSGRGGWDRGGNW